MGGGYRVYATYYAFALGATGNVTPHRTYHLTDADGTALEGVAAARGSVLYLLTGPTLYRRDIRTHPTV